MIDTVQAVLLLVIVLLTILLVVLGIQVFFILREFRKVLSVTVRVRKPGAPIKGVVDTIEVEVTRGR